MVVTRWLLSVLLHLHGSLWAGPWSYRGVYVVVGPPVYSLVVLFAGSIVGQHVYFRRRVFGFWGRLLPWQRPVHQERQRPI